MAFNRKIKLKDNMDAIRLVFELEKSGRKATSQEKAVLERYCGFGGLKCILYPANSLSDISRWPKSDMDLFPMVVQLHGIIQNNTTDGEYRQYINSIKNSILTAFYTPQVIVDTLADVFQSHGIKPERFLDPSAGQGAFVSAFGRNGTEVMVFEKDLITGKILSHLYPDHKVRVEGFERIEQQFNSYFDVVSSNIPFGNYKVFDPTFDNTPERKFTKNAIHNYFFAKALDSVHEGGLVVFITSQGVMNSMANMPVRQYLMNNAKLISAIRLPGNLFSEHAGTDVGSDLIVLQKESIGRLLTSEEKEFIRSFTQPDGMIQNGYLQRTAAIIHTDAKIGTDLYGKPAIEYIHNGGVEGIATDLRSILSADLEQRLDIDLYQQNSSKQEELPVAGVEHSNQRHTTKKIDYQRETIPVSNKQVKESVHTEKTSLTLFDLFEFERIEKVIPHHSNKKKSVKKASVPMSKERNLFTQSDQSISNSNDQFELPPEKEIGENDFFSINGFYEGSISPTSDQRDDLKPRTDELYQKDKEMKPRPFAGLMEPYLKEGSLVADKNLQIGYLKDITPSGAIFHPLELNHEQKQKAELYISIRNAYQRLYTDEAKKLEENKVQRTCLNDNYDRFVERFGNLNAKANVKLILMDASGRDILSLERVKDGRFIKADIFDHPVAFSKNETAHVDTAEEALSASLNKYGNVDLSYMKELSGITGSELIEELKGRIYFNPLVDNYEIADRFISGNIIDKVERIENWRLNHSHTSEVDESLKVLKEATPRPISFDELDFNFGERWIPTGIYSRYASYLFDTDVKITYSESLDDFSLRCDYRNANIYDKFAVKGQHRTYDGIALMGHALVNTVPDITKTVIIDDKEMKVRDSQAIQLANSKIDEIRNGFTDWLQEQSPEFQNKLADMYNRKFNCFVRPSYDGTHQSFPDLDLNSLGIPDLYKSQKDAIWMLKQNGGGIADHEVLRP